MSKIAVVGTYPAQGSRNIGDWLISDSVERIVASAFPASDVVQLFRAAEWSSVSNEIESADHVIFACLAVRNALSSKVYPYISQILDSGKPFSVVSAGTDMPVKESVNFASATDAETIEVLREMGSRAKVFTTRGVLSQAYCERIGVEGSVYRGDVAFYYPESYGVEFRSPKSIQHIVISDPHRALAYLESFEVLVEGLAQLFPAARIRIALHGVNPAVEAFCAERDVEAVRVYEGQMGGLGIYDSCDLHVGYRVHGHVSALSRRKLSYLLEQDGRGADYGLTLTRKVSVPNFLQVVQGRDGRKLHRASIAAPQQLLGLVQHDCLDGFSRFRGLGVELEHVSRANYQTIVDALEAS